MKRIVTMSIAALLLVCSLLTVARAGSETPMPSTGSPFVFTAVDAVEVIAAKNLVVKGVLDGGTQSTELQFFFLDSDAMNGCQKQALMAMDRPGRYALQLTYDAPLYRYVCRLTRR